MDNFEELFAGIETCNLRPRAATTRKPCPVCHTPQVELVGVRPDAKGHTALWRCRHCKHDWDCKVPATLPDNVTEKGMTDQTEMEQVEQQHVLLIRSTTTHGVINSSKDLCKVWPAHPENTALWNTTVVLENATKILDNGSPNLGPLDDLLIIMDGVAITDLSDELFGLVLDRNQDSLTESAGFDTGSRCLTHNVYSRAPNEVMFSPFSPRNAKVEPKKVNTTVAVVTDRINVHSEMAANNGTLLIHIHPSSSGYTLRGHTVHAIIIATTERLHPKLCQQISMLEGRGVKVIHNN